VVGWRVAEVHGAKIVKTKVAARTRWIMPERILVRPVP
jgi:hypothetical protein